MTPLAAYVFQSRLDVEWDPTGDGRVRYSVNDMIVNREAWEAALAVERAKAADFYVERVESRLVDLAASLTTR